MPLTKEMVQAFWDLFAAGSCNQSNILDKLSGFLKQGSGLGLRAMELLGTMLSRLTLWIWVALQIVGLAGDVFSLGGTTVLATNIGMVIGFVNGVLVLAPTVVDLFEAVKGLIEMFAEPVPVPGEANVAELDEMEFNELPDEPESPMPSPPAEGGEEATEPQADVDKRAELFDKLIDSGVILAGATFSALIGGAAIRFADRLAKMLKKVKKKPRVKKRKPRRGKPKCPRKCPTGSQKVRNRQRGTCRCKNTCGKKLKCMGTNCRLGNCLRAGQKLMATNGDWSVEAVPIGKRLLTWKEGEAGYAESLARPDEAFDSTYRVFWFMQEDDGGHHAEVGLLRPADWFDGATIGSWVELDLPEMGVEGDFQVIAMEPCPPIEEGPGRVVTGVFRFARGALFNVWVVGGDGPLGATAEHPVWSVDREDWVAVKDLRIGERMQGVNGTAMILAVEAAADEPVFNVEVDADHCYRVGRLGLVVHNASCKRTGWVNYGTDDDYDDPWSSAHYFGRPTGISALLTRSWIKGHGSEAWDRLIPPGFVNELPVGNRARGHLLGNQLGGSGRNPLNIVALFQETANNTVMRQCENRIRAAVQCGQCVWYWATPIYTKGDPIRSGLFRPTHIHLFARGDRGVILNVLIKNSAFAAVPAQCRRRVRSS